MIIYSSVRNAGVAQLVEQLICNQQVGGSSPSTSSTSSYGGVPEWPKGADCKSVAIASVVRIHPPPPKCLANRRGIFYALTSPNGDKSTKKKCATPNIELTFDYGSIITPFGDICQ